MRVRAGFDKVGNFIYRHGYQWPTIAWILKDDLGVVSRDGKSFHGGINAILHDWALSVRPIGVSSDTPPVCVPLAGCGNLISKIHRHGALYEDYA